MRTLVSFNMLLVLMILLVGGVCNGQAVMPSNPLPAEILAGLIAKYTAIAEQYRAQVAQGAKPESELQFRLSAYVDLSRLLSSSSGLDPILANLAKVSFLLNSSIFARYPSTVSISLSGTFGNIEMITDEAKTILVSRDDLVYCILPSDYNLLSSVEDLLPEWIPIPSDPLELQEQISQMLLQLLPNVTMRYGGISSTPKGIAHLVKISTPLGDMIASLWILDETWDLCKVEYIDPNLGVIATLNVDKLDLIALAPENAFYVDLVGMAELSCDDFINLITLKIVSASVVGAPVVADLYVSANKVVMGKTITVYANAMDNADKESELVPKFEYRGPDGSWHPISAVYEGTEPFGVWKAVFAPDVSFGIGDYDFKVSFTDTKGNTSEPFEFTKAVKVVAPPPTVLTFEPIDGQKDVPVTATISVTFSWEMDRASVQEAFSVTSSDGQLVRGSFTWSDKSMTFVPEGRLNFNDIYKVVISASAKSSLGITLDGNKNGLEDGSPIDNFSWSFSTEKKPILYPKVSKVQEIMQGDVVAVDLIVENITKLAKFSFEVTFNPSVLEALKVDKESFRSWMPRLKSTVGVDLWLPPVIDNKKGTVFIAVENTRPDGISGAGKLATLVFSAANVGESAILINNVSFSNVTGETYVPDVGETIITVRKYSLWDTNNDGIVDIRDFVAKSEADGTSADVNGDGVVDILDVITGKIDQKIWDINGDSIVDIKDFIKIMETRNINPDVNGDGVIDIRDLLLFDNPLAPVVAKSELGMNYPNPCNPETWIPFKLAKDAEVHIYIYDMKGTLIRTLNLGYKPAGVYSSKSRSAYWDGKNEFGEPVSSGIYFYTISAGEFSATKKMIVIK